MTRLTQTGDEVQSAINNSARLFNVINYGAGASGDVTSAFQSAIDAASAAGGGKVIVPAGSYIIGTSVQLTIKDGVKVEGDGRKITTINCKQGSNTMLAASGASFEIEGVCFTGDWDNDYTQGGHIAYFNQAGVISITNCRFEKSRYMGLAVSRCQGFISLNNEIEKTNGDGFAIWDTPNVIINASSFRYCDDDSISVHTTDGFVSPPRSRVVISNNTIADSQGIVCLGPKSVSINNNVMTRMMSYGIIVGAASSAFEQGNTSMLSINVNDNIITDVFERPHGGNDENYYIRIYGAPRQAGTLDAVPGLNDSVSGSIIDLYGENKGYFYNDNIDDLSALPSPGNYFIRVSGNKLTRTLPSVDNYSDWGYGALWPGNYNSGNDYDGAVTEADLTGYGFVIQGPLKNVLIESNIVSGVSHGIFFNDGAGIEDLWYDNFYVINNIFFRTTTYGVFWPDNTVSQQGLVFKGNLFDIDPLHEDTGRNSDGSWDSPNDLPAFGIANLSGAIIEHNTFKNTSWPIAEGGGAVNYIRGNILHADPAATGYSASNKGIGNCPKAGPSYTYVIEECDPTDADYGTIKNVLEVESNNQPSSGTYVTGHFVANSLTGNIIDRLLGWQRITTGSNHISGTDWQPIYGVSAEGGLSFISESISSAGGLTLDNGSHILSNSSGASYAVTLAAPTSAHLGITKTISMAAGDGTNTVTLALTNVVGGSAATTATFDAGGETLVLQAIQTGASSYAWLVLNEYGVTLS